MPKDSEQNVKLGRMLTQMRSGKLDIREGGQPIEVKGKLGEGGTKTVLDVQRGDRRVALAVPNSQDGVFTMQQKWSKAKQEPENTRQIRELGVPTNTHVERVQVNVNGADIEAIEFTRYQDLPMQVLDGKNRQSTPYKGRVLPRKLDKPTLESLLDGVAEDVTKLVDNGVALGKDSFNVAFEEGTGRPRVYLNDLGSMEKRPFRPTEVESVSQTYVQHTISSLINGLSEEEYQEHRKLFQDNEVDTYDGGIAGKIAKRIAKKLGK